MILQLGRLKSTMTKAYILLTVDPPKTKSTVQLLIGIPGAVVREVLGPYDVVVEIEAQSPEEITSFLRTKIRYIDGVTSTVTCLWLD